MKVVFVTSFFYPIKGGVETQIYELSKELIKKGYEVEVFTSDLLRHGKIKKYHENIDGIKIKRFKTWFRIGDFGSFFPGVFKAVKNSDADMIHVHSYRHPHNFSVLFTKKPSLLTLHWPNYPKGLRKWYLDILIKIFDKVFGHYLLNKYDKLLAVNKLEIPWIQNFNIKKNKIELLPNGINKEYLKKYNGDNFRKKYKIKSNELVVLCFGRIHKSKGFDQVIKIAKYFPKVKFFIIGKDDGYGKELRKLVDSDNVTLVFKEISEKEKLEIYNAADILIMPSYYEAFGIVALEAMTQKTAVIASNRGGLPWVVEDVGLTYKFNDLNDLRKKLELLIKNKKLRLNLSEKAYEKSKNFTWDKITSKLDKIYKNLD